MSEASAGWRRRGWFRPAVGRLGVVTRLRLTCRTSTAAPASAPSSSSDPIRSANVCPMTGMVRARTASSAASRRGPSNSSGGPESRTSPRSSADHDRCQGEPQQPSDRRQHGVGVLGGETGGATAQGRHAQDGLEAAASTARALVGVVVHDGDVADLAGGVVPADDERAVDHDPRTDTGADRDHHAAAGSLAVRELGERPGVGVVGDVHGDVEVGREQRGQRQVVPAAVRGLHDATVVVDDAGRRDPDADDRAVSRARAGHGTASRAAPPRRRPWRRRAGPSDGAARRRAASSRPRAGASRR